MFFNLTKYFLEDLKVHRVTQFMSILLLDRQALPSSLMFLKVHKTPYFHRFFHSPLSILGLIILMHVFSQFVARRFVYIWFAPT